MRRGQRGGSTDVAGSAGDAHPDDAETLAQRTCRDLCAWGPAPVPPVRFEGLPLFRCHGCGSEWTRDEDWTPAQANGRVARSVAAEAARRPRGGRRRGR